MSKLVIYSIIRSYVDTIKALSNVQESKEELTNLVKEISCTSQLKEHIDGRDVLRLTIILHNQ